MAWIATTRWIDSQVQTVNSAIDGFIENNELLDTDSGTRYANIRKYSYFTETQNVIIEGKRIEYNAVEYAFDAIMPGEGPEEFRSQSYNLYILIYFDGININYIINRNSDAKRILRRILGYSKMNEIIENDLAFSDDLLMWLVQKVFLEDSTFTFTNHDKTERILSINSIIGVRGETRDENKLSAQGDTMMNLLSTLTFILESSYLKQLVIRLEYGIHENIEIRMNDKKVVSINKEAYVGVYEEMDENQVLCQLTLLTYLDIIPKLIQAFAIEKEEDLWNNEVKKNFFDVVQNKLMARLDERKAAALRE